MVPPEGHELLAGSYNSAEVYRPTVLDPPATRTLPFPRRVAVGPLRAEAMVPPEDHVFSRRVVPLSGSHIAQIGGSADYQDLSVP